MIDCYIVERSKNFSWFNYFSTTRRLSNGNYREKKKEYDDILSCQIKNTSNERSIVYVIM